ncbi:MAG: helix-hairpin-helix domain-containing protein [Dysgonamonadaceae bacterium]|jgi:DNA uptake protein ComE-like DNA-binding protein|nr:helix-hairpin-helix domain-containing protein [Dysgonamonadaceae bacterium]
MWKDFFYFSKRERQGILILIVFIAGIFVGKFLFTPKTQSIAENEGTKDVNGNENGAFKTSGKENSVDMPTSVSTSVQRKNSDYMTRNQNLPPEKRTYYQQAEKPAAPSQTVLYPKAEKFAEGVVIELNVSDTTQLMKIPGIGPAFARRITGFGKSLGGFYRLEQLQEVYGMYEELYEQIAPYLRVDPNVIVAIPVNTASLDKMKAHPYLNFYQAKAIIEMRKKKGRLENISELRLLEEFTEADFERLAYYLAF